MLFRRAARSCYAAAAAGDRAADATDGERRDRAVDLRGHDERRRARPLPESEPASARRARRAPAVARRAAGRPVTSRGRSVLVVEDDQVVREVLSAALADEGYEVRTASDGAAGIEALRRWRP